MRSPPRLLDLFCGAGGAAKGYADAGFEVVGVDIAPQPRYPFEFHQADALDFLVAFGPEFDAVHASPPCQAYSAMSACRPGLANRYPQLLDATRSLLVNLSRPWVMENVGGSGLARQGDLFGTHGLLLCGLMFGTALYRHRLFESSVPLVPRDHPRHLVPASDAGHWKPGTVVTVAGNCAPIALARQVMGIDWMNRDELAEAIPPAYTRFIGEQLVAHVERRVTGA